MSNGIANKWKLDPLGKPLQKLIKLCIKYDFQGEKINIDNRISLKASEDNSALILCVNDNPFVRLGLSLTRALLSDIVNGFTFGMIDLANLRFATTDRTVTNRKFVKSVADTIERNLPSIEQKMKASAGNRWR